MATEVKRISPTNECGGRHVNWQGADLHRRLAEMHCRGFGPYIRAEKSSVLWRNQFGHAILDFLVDGLSYCTYSRA